MHWKGNGFGWGHVIWVKEYWTANWYIAPVETSLVENIGWHQGSYDVMAT